MRANLPKTVPDPALELLREIRAMLEVQGAQLGALAEQVGALSAAADRAKPRSRDLSLADRKALERLLPVVLAQIGPDAGFAVWELYDVASTKSIAGADMRIAFGELKPHRVGKLLRRASDAGVAVAGLRVEAAGRDGAGGKWRLIAD